MEFVERYGPWAVILGASDGIGAEFARQLAAKGVPSILIARREGPLRDIVAQIREETGVECVAASVDLVAPDAAAQVVAATGGREIGLFISNAGSDPAGSKFLDQDVSAWTTLAQRNVLNVIELTHHFGRVMRERRRGGLLIVSSGAAYGGGSFLTTYAGTKAFQLCFCEGLWSELRPFDVDVLTLIVGTTDTPTLRGLLDKAGLPMFPMDSAADVATKGLNNLGNGPVANMGKEDDEGGTEPLSAKARRERVLIMDQTSSHVFGTG